MSETKDKNEEPELYLEPEMTPEEKRKKRIFYVKWALFFGILIVLMLVCFIAILTL